MVEGFWQNQKGICAKQCDFESEKIEDVESESMRSIKCPVGQVYCLEKNQCSKVCGNDEKEMEEHEEEEDVNGVCPPGQVPSVGNFHIL